jgi:hypothetical protein
VVPMELSGLVSAFTAITEASASNGSTSGSGG